MNKSSLEDFYNWSIKKKMITSCIIGILLSFFLVFSILNSIPNAEDRTAFSLLQSNSIFLMCIPFFLLGITETILLNNINKGFPLKFIWKIVLCTFISVGSMFFTFLFIYIMYGCIDKIDLSEIFLRIFLSVFPFLRIALYLVFLFMVTRRIFIILLFEVMEFVFVGIFLEPNVGFFYTTGFSNIIEFFKVDSSSIYKVSPSDGIVDVFRYNSILEGSVVRLSLVYSLTFIIFYLMIIWVFLRKPNALVEEKGSSINDYKRYKLKWFMKILVLIAVSSINIVLFFIPFNGFFICFFGGMFVFSISVTLNNGKVKKMLSIVGVFVFLTSLLLGCFIPDHNKIDYVEEFDTIFCELKEKYILTEIKKIDWDELYQKYHVRFVDVNKSNDYIEKYKLYKQFAQEFYDGHVSFSMTDTSENDELAFSVYGNDYGLSLIRLDSGEYVAINVEGSNNSYSVVSNEMLDSGKTIVDFENRNNILNSEIHNGTVIISWDGKKIEDLCELVDVYALNFADETNRVYYLPVHAAGLGGESVIVSYIDDNGNVKETKLERLGMYYYRLIDSINKLNNGLDIGNLEWKDVNLSTEVLRVFQMTYNGTDGNIDSYSSMKQMLREGIEKCKNSGKKNIIIDIRNNTGGSPLMILELASLFAPEGKYIMGYSAKLNEKNLHFEKGDDGKYLIDEELSFEGENLWKIGNIVVLVNNQTVSAGDMFTYLMSDFPNVTIMGINGSNSSCQSKKMVFLNDGYYQYSAVPILDKNGDILIDTHFDHISNVPLDIKIPTTIDLVTCIFDKGEDYILNFAMQYISDFKE